MSDKDKTITILCAIRYCLGRREYYTKSVCDTAIEEWNVIPLNDKKTILEEIQRYTKSNECTGLERMIWNKILKLGYKDKLIVRN